MPRGADALPRITVVTPNLNGGDTLRRTIDSILQQDYPNLEFIVVDGGSRDNSRQIIAEHQDRIDCLVCGQDRTMYDGIAKGFDLATGAILAWLNSDDLYEPGLLRRVGGHFARHPRWAVIYFDGSVWKQGWRVPNRAQKYAGLPELLRGHILYQECVFFRRSAYESIGGLDRTFRLAGDYDLWLRLAARYRLHYVPETGGCFRIRPGQLSGNWHAYLTEMATARQRAFQRLPPGFALRCFPGRVLRKIASKVQRYGRHFVYDLDNENADWPAVQEPEPVPLQVCACPICARPPDRLLFSTPPIESAVATIRSFYFCSQCGCAFVFPARTGADAASIASAAGTHRLFRVSSLLRSPRYGQWFRRGRRLARRLGLSDTAQLAITERKDAAIGVRGASALEVVRWLRVRGYSNIHGTAQFRGPFQAIILHQMLEQTTDPADLLNGLSDQLTAGGRVYLTMPNLNSAWLNYYGPCWTYWHSSLPQFLTGPRGLRALARRTGYAVKWIRTRTSAEGLYRSDALGGQGLGAGLSGGGPVSDRQLLKQAAGAVVLSRIMHDWRQRGDWLHACLVKER
jgi:hypothetical protein